MQLLAAAAAEVMPTEQTAVFVLHLPADSARVSRPRMWGFTFGHPEERYWSRGNQASIREVYRCSAAWWVV